MSAILFDFNNLAFRTLFVKDVGITTEQPDFKIWKYMMINSIYESLYKVDKPSEVVLAIDDTRSWRSLYFPRYKERRKLQRDKQTDVDWKQLFKTLKEFSYEIREYLPFKVIQSQNSEADDIIGVLCLDVIKGKKYIISNDEDFLQLCSKDTVLYNPRKKQYVKHDNPEMFIIEKSLLGQAKDDIFNVITPSDWGKTPETEGKRKPGYGPAALKKTIAYGWEKWLKDKGLEENFKRNKILMDFHCIPATIRSGIIQEYKSYKLPDPENIYKFFNENNFRGFLEDFTFVERKLMELY